MLDPETTPESSERELIQILNDVSEKSEELFMENRRLQLENKELERNL